MSDESMWSTYEPSAAEYFDAIAHDTHKSGGSFEDAVSDYKNLMNTPSDYDGRMQGTVQKYKRKMKTPYSLPDKFCQQAGTCLSDLSDREIEMLRENDSKGYEKDAVGFGSWLLGKIIGFIDP